MDETIGTRADIRMIGGQLRQAHRKAGSADDNLGAPFNGGPDQRLEIGQGHHDVDADNTVRCDFVGLAKFGLEGLSLGLEIIRPL